MVSLSIFIAVKWLSGSKEKKRDRKGKRKLAFKLSKTWFYLISGAVETVEASLISLVSIKWLKNMSPRSLQVFQIFLRHFNVGDLMPRRGCFLTRFLFTSWPPGISFLYRACRCIFCICAFFFLFFVCVWKALVGKYILFLASANVFGLFSGSLTHLNSVEWHYDFHHLHPQTVHWPLLVGGRSLDPCQLADRSKFIDTSPSNSYSSS